MHYALDVRGLSKSYIAGSGTCIASAQVLRCIHLRVRPGESVAVVGESGAGKSTLMLCLAGLLRPDAGEIRWFGESDRGSAVRRALYHLSPADLMRQGSMNEPHIHLIDLRDGDAHVAHLKSWIIARLTAGDSAIIATRTLDTAAHYASRVISLRHGALVERSRARARVAEFTATAAPRGPI